MTMLQGFGGDRIMGFSEARELIARNEISADVSVDNGLDKLLEWWGIDKDKPEAIAQTTYYTCFKGSGRNNGKDAT